MLKKTLTGLAGLVLGSSLLFGSAKAEIIDVPCNRWSTNLQDYVDNAQPGDTLSFVGGDAPGLFSSATVNKDLNFEGNGFLLTQDFGFPNPLLTLTNNAVVTINNMGLYSNGVNAIDVLEDSSLNIYNSPLITSPTTSVYFNSTGNLNIDNSQFDTFDNPDEEKIALEKIVRDVKITRNTFVAGGTGVYVGEDLRLPGSEFEKSQFEIANNTFNGMKKEVFRLISLLVSSGNIINNAISNSTKDITNPEYLGIVAYTNNNIEPVQTEPLTALAKETLTALALATTENTNYSYYSMFVNPGAYNFSLLPKSPLWNIGLYIEGLTTWFPNANQTWIGAHGEGYPVPEPGTLELLVIGSLAGLGGLGYRALIKYKESL